MSTQQVRSEFQRNLEFLYFLYKKRHIAETMIALADSVNFIIKYIYDLFILDENKLTLCLSQKLIFMGFKYMQFFFKYWLHSSPPFPSAFNQHNIYLKRVSGNSSPLWMA
jgi:hypothetical protein